MRRTMTKISSLLLLTSLAGIACFADDNKSASSNKAKPSQKAADNSKLASSGSGKPGTAGSTGQKDGKSASSKPKVLPWKSFKKENERTYNIFKYNLTRKSIDTSNPDNWRSFDPLTFANKKKLVPEPESLTGVAPLKYSSDFSANMDPAKVGAFDDYGGKVVFAHQGTPLVNGWLAPKAGYAYQVDGMLIYGTSNYTPVNYNGNMSKFIGLGRVPVEFISPKGTREKPDLSRLVFAVNDDLLSRPQSKVYPSVIYLKTGETASIQGHGNVNCPRPGMAEQIKVQTPSGEQAIKVICLPDDAIIPGKISP